jgi:hypothetical protein
LRRLINAIPIGKTTIIKKNEKKEKEKRIRQVSFTKRKT